MEQSPDSYKNSHNYILPQQSYWQNKNATNIAAFTKCKSSVSITYIAQQYLLPSYLYPLPSTHLF
jgi:hypothetical protein